MLRDLPKAYEDISQALILTNEPGRRPSLLLRRADILVKLGRFDEAEQDLTEAAKSTNSDHRGGVFLERGLVKLRKNDWEGAEKDFLAAAALRSGRANAALENIGIIHLHKRQWKEAFDWCIKLRNAPDGSGGWMWMIEALAAERLGETAARKFAVGEFLTKGFDPKTSLYRLSFYLPEDLAKLAVSWLQEDAQ
jgi:tetratricopeptide (TPR) repeat protein